MEFQISVTEEELAEFPQEETKPKTIRPEEPSQQELQGTQIKLIEPKQPNPLKKPLKRLSKGRKYTPTPGNIPQLLELRIPRPTNPDLEKKVREWYNHK